MSHLCLRWIDGAAAEQVGTAALVRRVAGARRKSKPTIRRIGIAALIALLITLVFNVIAAVGMYGVLSRSPGSSTGGIPSAWGVRDGQV